MAAKKEAEKLGSSGNQPHLTSLARRK